MEMLSADQVLNKEPHASVNEMEISLSNLHWPSHKLDLFVHDVSGYKDDYRPENVLINEPANQNSRWSVDFARRQPYIVFRLNRPAVLDGVFFGKFEKVHTSSLRRFRLSAGLRLSAMTELITGELNHHNHHGETFPLPIFYNRNITGTPSNDSLLLKSNDAAAADNLLPSLFIKLEPLVTPALSSEYCSLWYIELHGVDAEQIVSPALERVKEYKKIESYRLMLKFFRQMRLREPYESLCRTTGISLEALELTQLHALLVDDEYNYEEAEKVVQHAARNGLFDEYVNQQAYKCRWQEIKPAPTTPFLIANGSKASCWPVARGGHAMCVDVMHRRIYVFGGWDGKQDLSDFWVFNLDTETWKRLSTDTLADGGPCARSCHRMVMDSRNQTIYVTGRFVDVRTISSLQLDHENIIPSIPVGQQGNNGNALVGGRNDFYSYNVERDEWQLISNCTETSNGPRLLFDHAMCIDEEGGVIYVFGGNVVQFRRTIDGYGAKTGRLSGMYAYHINSNKWQCLQRDASNMLNTRATPPVGNAVESSVTVADTATSVATSSTVGSSSSGNSSGGASNNSHQAPQQLIFHAVVEPDSAGATSIGGVSVNFAQQMQAGLQAAMAEAEEEQQAAMLIADYEGDDDEETESEQDVGHHIQQLFNQHNNNMADNDNDNDDDDEEAEGEGDDDGNEDDNSTVKDDEDDEADDSDEPPPLSPLEPSTPSSPAGHDAVSAGQNSNNNDNSSNSTSTAGHNAVPSKHSIPLRVGHCMLFHPKRRVLYIFGGRYGAYDFNDFITYDPARHECLSWAHSSSAVSGSSSVRGSGLMQRAVLDAERDEIYVHFGLGRDTATHICIANATTAATSTPTPAPHRPFSGITSFIAATSIAQRQQTLSELSNNEHGESISNVKRPGQLQQRAQINMNNSLWLYKIGTGEWTCFFSADAKRCGDGSEPCARYAHQVLYDSATRRLFVFGGNPSYSEQRSKRLNDLWRTSLVRYSREDVVRKCIFRIRTLEYLSLLRRAQTGGGVCTAFDVLNYLRTKLAPCVATYDTNNNNNMPDSGHKKRAVSSSQFDVDDNDDDRAKLHALANMLFATNQFPSAPPTIDDTDMDDRNERLKVFQYITSFVAENRTEPREDLCDFIRLQI